MIHTGEGHINILEVGAGGDHFPGQGHIGDHNDIGVLGTLDLYLGIGVLGIGLEGVTSIDQRLGTGVQDFIRHAQRFEKYNIHGGLTSSLEKF